MKIEFSAERFGQVWDFYRPAIMRQWWGTVAAMFVIYMLALLARATDSMGLFTLTTTLLVVPYYVSPLAFAAYRDRAVQVLLPASGAEKATFMLLYTIVVFPLAIVAIWFSIEGLFSMVGIEGNVLNAFDGRIARDFDKLQIGNVRLFSFQRVVSELLPGLVCLYVVVSSRTQRVMKGIGGIVAAVVAEGFVGGVYGLWLGFKIASLHNFNGELDAAQVEDAALAIVRDTAPVVLTVVSVLLPLLLIVGIVLTWRRIVNVQV